MELSCYQPSHPVLSPFMEMGKIFAFKIIKLNPLLNNPCFRNNPFLTPCLSLLALLVMITLHNSPLESYMNKFYEHFSCCFCWWQTYFLMNSFFRILCCKVSGLVSLPRLNSTWFHIELPFKVGTVVVEWIQWVGGIIGVWSLINIALRSWRDHIIWRKVSTRLTA